MRVYYVNLISERNCNVIINERFNALTIYIKKILLDPGIYGLEDTSRGVSLLDVLECAITSKEWFWITKDILYDAIERSNEVLIDGCYISINGKNDKKFQSKFQKKLIKGRFYYPTFKKIEYVDNDLAYIEIFPEKIWRKLLEERKNIRSKFLKIYTKLEDALVVSWGLTGDLKKCEVKLLHLENYEGVWLSDEVVLIKGLNLNLFKSIEIKPESKQIRKIQVEIWTKEVLYLDEPGMQSISIANLYKVLPQEKVESLLISHFNNKDPEVRINILIALGWPAYKIGFAPGAPLPTRSIRLGHVTLQESTLRFLLSELKNENTQRVLDNYVCLFSSQYFGGKLLHLEDEVRYSLTELKPRLISEQSVRDCSKILRDLRINWNYNVKPE